MAEVQGVRKDLLEHNSSAYADLQATLNSKRHTVKLDVNLYDGDN